MEKRAISDTEEYTSKKDKDVYNNVKNLLAKDFKKDKESNKKEKNKTS